MKRDIKVYLQDILESIKLIREYTAGVSEKEFTTDSKLQDAVIRRLEIIGEAVKNLPQKFREQYREMPWKAIAGMRDVLVHEYFGVEMRRINKVLKEDLVDLEAKLKIILKDLK